MEATIGTFVPRNGKLAHRDKDAAMEAFARGDTQILAAERIEEAPPARAPAATAPRAPTGGGAR